MYTDKERLYGGGRDCTYMNTLINLLCKKNCFFWVVHLINYCLWKNIRLRNSFTEFHLINLKDFLKNILHQNEIFFDWIWDVMCHFENIINILTRTKFYLNIVSFFAHISCLTNTNKKAIKNEKRKSNGWKYLKIGVKVTARDMRRLEGNTRSCFVVFSQSQ